MAPQLLLNAQSSALGDMWRADVSSLVLGTAPAATRPMFQAYPNPSESGRFRVLLPGTKIVQLSVRDAQGREVRAARTARGGTEYELNLADQPAGLYLVRTQEAGQPATQCRLVRQ